MSILIPKKPTTPPIDCDAVDERIRNGDSTVTDEEYAAVRRREAKDWTSRATAAAVLGITPRTLLRWHHQNYGPKRELKSDRCYSRAEVEAWVAEHGPGSRRPRSARKAAFSPSYGGQPAVASSLD